MLRLFERVFGRAPAGEGWDLRVEHKGRGGPITYVEGAVEIKFDFELGPQEIGGFIYCPSSADWDAKYPWAAGRRDQVVQRMATRFVRQEFKGYTFGLEDGRDDIIVIRRTART